MKEPTKADLAAAVTRLTEEVAALRELLAAVSAYAELPHPASYDNRSYEYELERRVDAIAIWANGGREDMAPDVYVLVIQDRAKHLREEAARPVRYEVRAEPASPEAVAAPAAPIAPNPPYHATGQACQAVDNESAGYICTAQDGHDGPDHIAYKLGGGEYHRWPVAAAVLAAPIADGTPVVVTDDEPEDHPDTAGPAYGEAELRRADAYREPRGVTA